MWLQNIVTFHVKLILRLCTNIKVKGVERFFKNKKFFTFIIKNYPFPREVDIKADMCEKQFLKKYKKRRRRFYTCYLFCVKLILKEAMNKNDLKKIQSLFSA